MNLFGYIPYSTFKRPTTFVTRIAAEEQDISKTNLAAFEASCQLQLDPANWGRGMAWEWWPMHQRKYEGFPS